MAERPLGFGRPDGPASGSTATVTPPIEGAELRPAGQDDAAELLVLQRCCWVDEAIANDTLDIGALHESLDDIRRRATATTPEPPPEAS